MNYGYEFLFDTYQSGFLNSYYGSVELSNITCESIMSVSGIFEERKTVLFNFLNTETIIVKNCEFRNIFVNSLFSIKIGDLSINSSVLIEDTLIENLSATDEGINYYNPIGENRVSINNCNFSNMVAAN